MTHERTENYQFIQVPHRHIAQRIFKVDTLTSTNRILLENPSDTYQSGDVLWSLEQTAGHGRFNRSWFSEKGGLYFSILFEDIPNLSSFYPFVLLCALAIRNTLAKKTTENIFSIKWPNDVYSNHHKIAGILIQSCSLGKVSRAVIGIGININNPIQHLQALHTPAISLCEITGQQEPLEPLLQDILDTINSYYIDFINNRFSLYLPALNRALYSKDMPLLLAETKRQRIVIPKEFTKEGYLLCEENGKTVILMI
ncbi:MAG: biotin--[acetyl-CoA-carboxylase] ligase [Candidatus Marinimicrobia bacterium]|nr:biotin--[acetyl-CoA-carboxylase] ligase [Candidatus Neomarinimicrobiota bacterium]